MEVLWGFLLSILCTAAEVAEAEGLQEPVLLRLAALETKVRELEEQNLYMRTKGFKTCRDLKTRSGIKTTGEYFLDPAQSGAAVKVFCDMEKEETVIGHDGEELTIVEFCTGDGCYVKNLTYTIPDSQIEALIELSDTCEQDIQFGCKMAPLKNQNIGNFFGWWIGRDGREKYYFDGSDEDSQVCGCAASSSCLPLQSSFNSTTCNCDADFLPQWTKDEGTLTNKASLPVKAFVYGGFISRKQEANLTVSKLRCSGSPATSQGTASSCAGLKRSGVSANGFYITKETDEADMEASYCHMSKPGFAEDDLRTISSPFHKSKTPVLNVLLNSNSDRERQYYTCTSLKGQSYSHYSHTYSKGGFQYEESDLEFNSIAVKEHFELTSGTFTFQESGIYTISNSGERCGMKFKLDFLWLDSCYSTCTHFVKKGQRLEIWRESYDKKGRSYAKAVHLVITQL